MLLGGSGKVATKINPRNHRDRAEHHLEGAAAHRSLHDLRTAWQAVSTIDFTLENFETEPQLLQNLAPNEAVVAISMEVRIGDTAGMMNIGIPSIIIKMLRQKFEASSGVAFARRAPPRKSARARTAADPAGDHEPGCPADGSEARCRGAAGLKGRRYSGVRLPGGSSAGYYREWEDQVLWRDCLNREEAWILYSTVDVG